MADYRFTVVVERDENGAYCVVCPALQGCCTSGGTYEEALRNIREAIQLHIEDRIASGEPIPQDLGAQQVEVHVEALPGAAG